MAKNEVATRKESAMAVAQKAIVEMSSSGEFDYEEMITGIMEAESIDELLSSEVVHLKDIIGTPFTVHSAQVQQSEYKDSFLPVYAVMKVTYDDGREAIVTTGATQVVAVMVKAHASGFFPFRCSTSMTTTSNGNDVVKLIKAPDKLPGF